MIYNGVNGIVVDFSYSIFPIKSVNFSFYSNYPKIVFYSFFWKKQKENTKIERNTY